MSSEHLDVPQRPSDSRDCARCIGDECASGARTCLTEQYVVRVSDGLQLAAAQFETVATKRKQEEKPIMRKLLSLMAALGTFTTCAVVSADPSLALTAKECSAKYKAAKTAGTLNGETWNEFRKKECAGAEPAATEKATKAETKPTATAAPSGAVFPKAVDPKYAKKSAGKARFYTCLDQYKANKAANGSGGLK